MSTTCGRPQRGLVSRERISTGERRGPKQDFIVDVTNGWPPYGDDHYRAVNYRNFHCIQFKEDTTTDQPTDFKEATANAIQRDVLILKWSLYRLGPSHAIGHVQQRGMLWHFEIIIGLWFCRSFISCWPTKQAMQLKICLRQRGCLIPSSVQWVQIIIMSKIMSLVLWFIFLHLF